MIQEGGFAHQLDNLLLGDELEIVEAERWGDSEVLE